MIKGLNGGNLPSAPGIDFDQLEKRFALKDDLEKAEKSISELKKGVEKAVEGNKKLFEIFETEMKANVVRDGKIKACEVEIEILKGVSNKDEGPKFDPKEVLAKLAILEEKMRAQVGPADLDKLKQDLINKIESNVEGLRIEVTRNKQDFDNFKKSAFYDLQQKVKLLEKKVNETIEKRL